MREPPSNLAAGLKSFLNLALFAAAAHILLGERTLALVDLAAFAAGRISALLADRRSGPCPDSRLLSRLSRTGARFAGALAVTAAASFAVLLAAEGILRGSPSWATVLDAVVTAAGCSALLVPLGFPLAAALLIALVRRRPSGEARSLALGIRAALVYQVRSTIGMASAVYAAVLAGWLPPLAAPQLLWANLAVPALASLALGVSMADEPESGLPEPGIPGGAGALFRGEAGRAVAGGLILGGTILALYRVSLGSFLGNAEPVAYCRGLSLLALGLAQAVMPLYLAGKARFRTRILAAASGIAPTAIAFAPGVRSLLDLRLPEAGAMGFAALAAAAYSLAAWGLEEACGRGAGGGAARTPSNN